MKTCKTCIYWEAPLDSNHLERDICRPIDFDSDLPMDRGFETNICRMPTQTRYEPPVESNGFGLTDGSEYYAVLFTAEDFGCIRHKDQE